MITFWLTEAQVRPVLIPCHTQPDAHASPSCTKGRGLEEGGLRGGAVRRALQGLATDLCAALGSRQTDQMLSARLNPDG